MSLKEDLAEWQECQTKRKALEREAKTLRDRESQLEEKFEAELTKSEKQSIVRNGFTLAWIAGRATVQWAAEYLKECGAEKANALKQAAAESAEKKLTISPPVG
jgi:hypothetical protein